MSDNEVTLLVGTQKLAGWKSVSVSRALDALADTFEFTLVDVRESGLTPFSPSKTCVITIEKSVGGLDIREKVLTGYIDNVSMDVDSGMLSLRISGRSKTADIVDCSAEYLPSNSWNKTLLSTIVRDLLVPLGLSLDFISTQASSRDAILSITLNAGDSIFDVIDKECRKRGILAVTNPSGELELITIGDRVSRDKLIYGENVISASISFDYANRYSQYKVKGQKSGDGDGWTTSKIQIFGEATDGIFQSQRTRLKIMSMDSDGTNKDAQNMAAWEAQTRAGKTGKLSVRVPSWFQSDNTLWEVGTLIFCGIPPLRIAEQLLVNSVRFSQDDSGSICDLELVHADTYLPEPSKTVKVKGKQQSFGGW